MRSFFATFWKTIVVLIVLALVAWLTLGPAAAFTGASDLPGAHGDRYGRLRQAI